MPSSHSCTLCKTVTFVLASGPEATNPRVDRQEGIIGMVRVLVLGHIRLYRDGLASLIASHETLEVIGAAPIDDNLPRLVTSERPDIVLVDGASVRGGDLVRRILASVPEASIVAYGILDEEHEAIDCAEAGVAGYVRGDATRDELVATIV